ncbi:MAG: BTAD domain-containing putative transcriptional regulator [Microthrixaceae bacterium]
MRGAETTDGGASLRFEPPRVAASVLRADLIGVMRGRFDRRLTAIVGGAGFGKSTLLAQAVAENRIERLGIDVWLRVDERDQSAPHLLGALGTALGLGGGEHVIDDIVEAVWSRAPESVALLIDDVHKLGEVSAGWEVLSVLLDRLPANGHLVLSSRTPPSVGTARLRSAGDAAVIDEAALQFSEAELADLAQLRDLSPELGRELPTWPALATLTGVVGTKAGLEYLWEEVLEGLSEQRRRLIAALVPFGDIDDELVAALGSQVSAAEVVEGLPLVDTTDSGALRLHDLWVDALANVLSDDERNEALRTGARLLHRRGQLVAAAEAYAQAGDEAGLAEVVLTYARQPTLDANNPETDRLASLLPHSMRSQPSARYLEAARHFAFDPLHGMALLELAADAARREGAGELEALSLWRVVQIELLDDNVEPRCQARLAELAAAGNAIADGALHFIESAVAQESGDIAGAWLALNRVEGFTPEQREAAVRLRLIDLGKPEALGTSLDDVLAGGLTDISGAQAVWLQGQIRPRDAWPLARELPTTSGDLTLITRVSLNAVVATIAVAAGQLDEARVLSNRASREAAAAPGGIRRFAEVAMALADLVCESEEACLDRLRACLAEAPLEPWPDRPYLHALAALRGLIPETEWLDRAPFGPAMRTAVEAGAALAALRAGDVGPARQLPWYAPDLLRVHVPPPLLCELALAAEDVAGSAEVLGQLPHLRDWARRIADRGEGPIAPAAAELLARLPARPDYDLRLTLLGDLSLKRSDGEAVNGALKREKVRQLLAYLGCRRDVGRDEVVAELWPDLPDDKARSNLRVNLHHLQQALQPNRHSGDPPWFLRQEASRLVLCDGVTSDVEELDAAMAEGVAAEAAGLATKALEAYRTAGELYSGELLPGAEGDWVSYERIRLQSVAHAAAARHGELELARGEPEVALKLALDAHRLDPLSERAHRLAVRCHLALGSTGAARETALRFRDELTSNDLTPELDTTSLWARLDL